MEMDEQKKKILREDCEKIAKAWQGYAVTGKGENHLVIHVNPPDTFPIALVVFIDSSDYPDSITVVVPPYLKEVIESSSEIKNWLNKVYLDFRKMEYLYKVPVKIAYGKWNHDLKLKAGEDVEIDLGPTTEEYQKYIGEYFIPQYDDPGHMYLLLPLGCLLNGERRLEYYDERVMKKFIEEAPLRSICFDCNLRERCERKIRKD